MRIDWWSPELAGLVRQSHALALNVVKGMVRACPFDYAQDRDEWEIPS